MALAPQRLWTNHACIPDTIIVPHPDIERFVYAKVGFLARQLHRISAAILTEEGTAADRLTGIQCGVLEVVNAMGSVDQTGVCEILGVDRSTLAGVVDRLQERALIERTVDPVDRRSNALAITSAGRRAIERERVMNERTHERIVEPLAPEDRVRFLALLTQVVQAHSRYTGISEDAASLTAPE
jgi:DNA-binding MarR family transcriptional regulator